MNMHRIGVALLMSLSSFAINAAEPPGNAIVLTSSQWLGPLNLDATRLEAIQKAVVKALDAPVDAEQQCGDETGLCTARAARDWAHEGTRYREIVVNVHMVGHASQTVKQAGGKWPEVRIK